MNETWVTVAGNVSTEVTWRRNADDSVVANFRMMSNSRKFDQASGSWQDKHTLSVRVNCWRTLAENVRESVTKGDPVVVYGKLFTRDYEVEGVRRTSTEIEASHVGLDLNRVRTRVVPYPRIAAEPPTDVSHLEVLEPPAFDEFADATVIDAGLRAEASAEAEDDDPLGRAALAG
ncbi:single-stranded DNA-binding protein [Actinomycetospora termitidis]|uniref:Single-stranded DNA-binding protein n=1 Tax=Actinomycetospora termitidis TaxID=3053470 RepID=A0ABT7MLT0_9PSEU|nr:single-stranded DNA-binding protein [Actinomycetospora sp. Odt1-22]MDL5160618.1 single-stranded DNA-binding protein [Actinomycetospora sp. Odt1-22]